MNTNNPITNHATALLPAMIAITNLRDHGCTTTSGHCPMALDSGHTVARGCR